MGEDSAARVRGEGRLIAVDTNVLVYAHREDAPLHDAAYERLESLATGRAAWAVLWPCVHEFLSIVTHPRIFKPPTPLASAIDQVAAWLESPSLLLLGESAGYWDVLQRLLVAGHVGGPLVHDGRVAALCVQHGVTELWSADRDFSRFAGLTVRNPLVE